MNSETAYYTSKHTSDSENGGKNASLIETDVQRRPQYNPSNSYL